MDPSSLPDQHDFEWLLGVKLVAGLVVTVGVIHFGILGVAGRRNRLCLRGIGEIIVGLVLMLAVTLWAKAQPPSNKRWAVPLFLLAFLIVTAGAGDAAEGLKQAGMRPLGFDLGVIETALLLLGVLLPVAVVIIRMSK